MNARYIAYAMLKEICIEGVYSNLLLRNELDKAQEKDRGFITQIVYGTLQNARRCRYDWEEYAKKLPSNEVAIVLDMSVYQMFYMDKVPTYAIINEAVQIAKKHIHGNYGSMVNAILHNVERNGRRKLQGGDEEMLAIETSHPTWIVAMWKHQYGWETTKQMCHANLETKPNAVRVNTMRIAKEELLEQCSDFKEGLLAQDALWYMGRDLIHSSYYEEGYISIQDEASQLVARIVDPQPMECILDVCSAPGTKACHMAELMNDQGHIVCGDIHEHRVELIKQGAKRLLLTSIDASVMDATNFNEQKDMQYDRVLCDVPCSGYGVLARKSDIKYHMKSSDMDTLIPLQKQILYTASNHVKEEGFLVYSTCTLNKKENEKQIEGFLKEHPNFQLVEERTIFPFDYQSDGFYMAKLQKHTNESSCCVNLSI